MSELIFFKSILKDPCRKDEFLHQMINCIKHFKSKIEVFIQSIIELMESAVIIFIEFSI